MARAEFEALGLRNVPVTVVGGEVLSGFNPAGLARLFRLTETAHKQIADSRLFDTLDKVMEAVLRAVRQVPPDSLGWTTPDRDRPLKVFCYHILADPNHVLDAIASQTYDGGFKLTYAEDSASLTDMEAVAEYGERARTRLRQSSVKLTAEELGRTIDGYAGKTDGHELSHQLLSHTAHHLRQLYAILGMIGVEPKAPLTEQDFHGIPMPKELW